MNTINCSDLRTICLQIVLWEFENSQLQVELCPVTNQVAFYSAHVRLNGSNLDLINVRYLNESGVYQCVAENPHGMIASYTVVNVRGKHLENYIYTIEPSFPYYKSGLFLCFKMNQFFICFGQHHAHNPRVTYKPEKSRKRGGERLLSISQQRIF